MQATVTEPSSLVSAKLYALILSSARLKKMLLPEGLITSPYEILDYQATLTLEDPKGMKATFKRNEEVRFLQNGVAGILEHAWGEGIILTSFHHQAGTIEDSFKDEGKRHLLVGLKRAMAKGESLRFEVVRKVMAQFTRDEEWVETMKDHPIRRLAYSVIFPKERPCQRAVMRSQGLEMPLPIVKLGNGRTVVRFDTHKPFVGAPYTIRWSW